MAGMDHAPAHLELARLTRCGDVFEFGADVEYFFLARACVLGADCDAHKARRKALASQFSGTVKALIDAAAQEDNMTVMMFDIWPMLHNASLEEKWRRP